MNEIAAIWRAEAARVIGVAARVVRDVSLGEEFAQDALVAALEQWPRTGIPDRPGAWLVTVARNRALNHLKRAQVGARVAETFAQVTPPEPTMHEIDDDVLRLIFTACHPVLPAEARVALTLRLVGGLTTEEIARAYLAADTTVAQRIVRAKKALADAQVPYEVPSGEELSPRLASVLEVVYLIFNEGYSAVRAELVGEALRLVRLLATLAPLEPEVHGLHALMCFHASRAATRLDAEGNPVLLTVQDRTKWDPELIEAGTIALARADALAPVPGTYRLEAAIAACHARAASVETTDWARIADLYLQLGTISPSPVIELNRAVAVSRADGPAAGLKLLDKLRRDPAMAAYYLLPSARADLLEQLGRLDEARAELQRAAELAPHPRNRDRLRARAEALADRDAEKR